MSALQKLHTTKKQGPSAHSLFLDQILASSGGPYRGENFIGERLAKSVVLHPSGAVAGGTEAAAAVGVGSDGTGVGSMARAIEERIMNTIAESKVGKET